MAAGKCPHCDGFVTFLNGNGVEARFGEAILRSVTYSCPLCHRVLGCATDPLALKSDIVSEITKEIKRH